MNKPSKSYITQPQHFVRNFARRLLKFGLLMVSFGLPLTGNIQVTQAAQSQQHEWVGDVPIMSELFVEPELGFAFDSPNGRIVMIFASSAASSKDILEFYNESLVAIGWVGVDGVWQRDSETLVISEVATTAGRLWRLLVRPN